jgi:hypothetical protein
MILKFRLKVFLKGFGCELIEEDLITILDRLGSKNARDSLSVEYEELCQLFHNSS